MKRLLFNQLRQGSTPGKLALSVALGFAIGLIPLYGTAAVICLAVGFALRLNHVVLQAINALTTFFYLPTLALFMQIGAFILGAKPVNFSMEKIAAKFSHSPETILDYLGRASLHSMIGWAVSAPLIAGALYCVALPAMRRLSKSSTL